MANFTLSYKQTMGIEGGYANNPADTGGETWKGVSRNNTPKWSGWKIVDALRSKPGFPHNLADSPELEAAVQSIYKSDYWDVYSLDQCASQIIADMIFDTGVNCGTGIAAEFLQVALNVLNNNQVLYPDLTVDRAVGPKTITALNARIAKDEHVIYKVIAILKGSRYIDIAKAKPTQEQFMRSWLSRVDFK
jgi:lysozyme family protein